LGEKVRNELMPLIMSGDKVILDFSGVKVVAHSFADECIGKLLLEMPLEELKQRTTFQGLDDLAKRHIVIAFRRRLESLAPSVSST